MFDYYKDLVTEIKLETKVDGGDVVGHEKPFGVFVNLRHTREIERESGGFGRYLQNQNNNNNYYYYNFGRPLENYRDKFQDAAKLALQEHFEVLSVTFQDEKVNSKATGDYGWRVTPYAYLLLKARRPEDRQDPAAPAGPRLHGHLGLRGLARRVADDPRGRRHRPAEPSAPSRNSRSPRRSTSGRPRTAS